MKDYRSYFKNVIGYAAIKEELYQQLDIMHNPDKYRKLGAKLEKGIILYGNPGVGKSLMANCFLEASGRKFYVIRKDNKNDNFTEYLASKFDEILKEKEPSVILLDDLDKFSATGCENDDCYTMLQTFIDEIDKDKIFIIATCNNISVLSYSLTREGRLGHKIQINPASRKDAIKIVEYFLKDKKLDKEVNAKQVTELLQGKTCATLQSIIEQAALYAGYQNKDAISMDDIIKSYMRVVYKAPLCEEERSDNYLKKVSVHEAAHVAVAELLKSESVILSTIKSSDSDIGGFTLYDQDDDYFGNIQQMRDRVVALLASKAGTEIIYGEPDIGFCNDQQRAYDIVKRFVSDYSDSGFFNTNAGSEEIYSNKLGDQQVVIIQSKIQEYYNKAKKLLINNKDFFDSLISELYAKRTITKSDIQRIKNNCNLAEA